MKNVDEFVYVITLKRLSNEGSGVFQIRDGDRCVYTRKNTTHDDPGG